ncbi:MAG: transposase [Methylococcales bacterium]
MGGRCPARRNGRLGKVDNCQVGVFAALCQGASASLIDARLVLPEDWTNNPERCERPAIPEPFRCFQSKTSLALGMLEDAIRRGLQFGYVGIDGGYGKEPAFLRSVDGLKRRFVADVCLVIKAFIRRIPIRRFLCGKAVVSAPSGSSPNAMLYRSRTTGLDRSGFRSNGSQ